MKNYRTCRNYENLEKGVFLGVGKYNIPKIQATEYTGCEFISFNYAKSCKDKNRKGIHFFIDDYQFTRLWTDIKNYTDLLSQFKYVLTPDFSTYTDYPMAIQIYNHYRKHWIGVYLQNYGIKIIPTISWSNEKSFEWCFDGEPSNSVVAISSIGTQNNQESKELFLTGYQEMMKRLSPKQIIAYGKLPEKCKGNIVSIASFQEKFTEDVGHGR